MLNEKHDFDWRFSIFFNSEQNDLLLYGLLKNKIRRLIDRERIWEPSADTKKKVYIYSTYIYICVYKLMCIWGMSYIFCIYYKPQSNITKVFSCLILTNYNDFMRIHIWRIKYYYTHVRRTMAGAQKVRTSSRCSFWNKLFFLFTAAHVYTTIKPYNVIIYLYIIL